jgi:alpha-tubulin suppressor-like RCC1 family protein
MQIPGTWDAGRGKIQIGQLQSAAIKTDGTLWSWGYNKKGVLGLNTTCPGSDCYFSSPTQVGTDTSWQHVLGGYNTVNAIKTDGTLWVWGDASYGQLGLNDTAARSSPTQIPGTTWAWASGANENMMATKTDGTMWVWGNSRHGGLGLNQAHATKISSPTQIPGTTWALKEFSTIDRAAMTALKTDGTAWVWGENEDGQLGLNTAVSHSSPVQIPGTSWTRIDGNPYLGLCILKGV